MLIDNYYFETSHGYKSFELHLFDLMDINVESDCLIISTFKRDYCLTGRTMLDALFAMGINVAELAENPELDLRDPCDNDKFHCNKYNSFFLDCWISKELPKSRNYSFNRIICVESPYDGAKFIEQARKLFSFISILEFYDIKIKSLAMSLINTGDQNYDLDEVVKNIMRYSEKTLFSVGHLERIYLFARDEKKVEKLKLSLDCLYKKDIENTMTNKSIDLELLKEISGKMKMIRNKLSNTTYSFQLYPLTELLGKLEMCNSVSISDIAVVCRKILELAVLQISDQDRLKNDLMKEIENLSEKKKIAPWILSYFHTLRVFGNYYCHLQSGNLKTPEGIIASDHQPYLQSIRRVTEFWLWYIETKVGIKA